MVVRKAAFETVGPFGTGWQLGEFIDWYSRAAEHGLQSRVLPQVVMHRRIHRTNLGIRERHSQIDYVRVIKAALDRRRAAKPGKCDS